MYFPFFKPQSGGKRFAAQPQTIYSEFPMICFSSKGAPLGENFSLFPEAEAV